MGEQKAARTFPSTLLLYLVLFLLFTGVYGTFVQDVGPNQLSRLNLALALAHEGRLEIDTYTANAVDRAFYNGHYYSDKAPLVSFLAYPVYQGLRHLQHVDQYPLDSRLMLTYLLWVLNTTLNAPLTALLLLLFLHAGRVLRPRSEMPWITTFVLAFGTLLFPYATMLFGHNVAALLGFAPFFIALLVREGKLPSPWLFLAGLLAGLGVLAEYPNGVFVIGLLFYIWAIRGSARDVGWYILGGIGPALALATYNTLAFGHPLHFSYLYHAAPWGAEHRHGLLGVRWPRPDHLIQILFSAKGLFLLVPPALLAPVAYLSLWRHRQRRAEFWLTLLIPLTVLLLNAGYFYTLGGSSPGPRFLVPTFPYLFLPYVFLGKRWRWPLVILGVTGTAIQLSITVVNPLVGRYAHPLRDYWMPRFLRGEVKAGLVLRQRLGIPYRLALLLLLFQMALGPLVVWGVYHLPARLARLLLWGSLVLALGFYLIGAFPLDLRHPTQVPHLYTRPSPPVRDNPPVPWKTTP